MLIVQDAAGCEIDRFFSIPQPDDYLLETSPDVSIEFGETATIEAITNIPTDHIAEMYWTPYVEIDCRECLETTVAPKGTVTYTFTIITKNGCELHQSVTVFVSERFPVFIPNVFSPNNDGINDRFYIFGDDAIAEIEDFKIFNRWGSLVFEQQHFQPNDPAFGWDGNFGNSQLDEGVFTYFAIVRFKEGLTQLYKGDITLIR